MGTISRTSNLLLRQRAAFSLNCARRGLASLTRQPQPTHPYVVRPSEAEVHNKCLAPRNLELAIRSLHADGLVVVEDVVPDKDLDALNKKMVEDARYLQSLGDKGPFNYNQGNLQQDPPPVAEFFCKSIFTSPSRFHLMLMEALVLMKGNRPHRNTNHINSPRPSSEMDFLLRQLGHAAPPRCFTSATTRALGRRL